MVCRVYNLLTSGDFLHSGNRDDSSPACECVKNDGHSNDHAYVCMVEVDLLHIHNKQ
jgi:hypothetical protein